MKTYQIGDIYFSYESENYEMKKSEWTSAFEVDSSVKEKLKREIVYEFYWENWEKLRETRPIVKTSVYELYEWEADKILIYHWESCRFAFGFRLSDIESKDRVPCYLNPKMRELHPLHELKLFAAAGMHRKLLQEDGVVFHAAYVEWKGNAILFAGISGTGKSTQAELWETYTEARIINGDRALLKKKEGIWYAYGYPICGSSDISKNETYPIRAIVLIEQDKENEVHSVTAGEGIRALLTGCEVHVWNQHEISKVADIAEKVQKEVPIIRLKCRKDEQAVTVLKKYLEDK